MLLLQLPEVIDSSASLVQPSSAHEFLTASVQCEQWIGSEQQSLQGKPPTQFVIPLGQDRLDKGEGSLFLGLMLNSS
jgi:hypothetical protein